MRRTNRMSQTSLFFPDDVEEHQEEEYYLDVL